ncbi:MAG TPA: hypothetical protein PKD85_02435 [Saprospiraceae bacterium]|nr:hypothetical protein [Saprospiraceae bacterium]
MVYNLGHKVVFLWAFCKPFFAMIIPFMSCTTHQNPSTYHPQMKELKLRDAEILELYALDQSDEAIYHLSFTYDSKVQNATFYYQQHSGTIQESHPKHNCHVILTKKHHELPRSVYPLLTQGYIVVQFNRFGWETYQVIKDFKKMD